MFEYNIVKNFLLHTFLKSCSGRARVHERGAAAGLLPVRVLWHVLLGRRADAGEHVEAPALRQVQEYAAGVPQAEDAAALEEHHGFPD